MPDIEVYKAKTAHAYDAVFGVEGQGGLIREVEAVQEKVAEQDKRLASISMKWMILMGLVGVLGNALGQKIVALLPLLKLFNH